MWLKIHKSVESKKMKQCKNSVCVYMGFVTPLIIISSTWPPTTLLFFQSVVSQIVCVDKMPLRWLVSVLCTKGLVLSLVYIKPVFTDLITRIKALFLLCRAEGWSPLTTVSVFCGLSWPAYGSSSQQSPQRGTDLRARPPFV